MKTSNNGIALIKHFEGCKLVVYEDIVGLPTVGFGHRTDLAVGTKISQNTADNLLRADLLKFENGIQELCNVELNQNQFDALIDFVYNVGLGTLQKSELLFRINCLDFESAASYFLQYNHAGGKVIDGLTERREAEKDLFLS